MPISSSKIFRYALFILVVSAVFYFLFMVREVLLTFILGALLAYLLFRPVRFIENKGLNRIWAILVLYLLLIGIFALILSFAIPGIINELRELAGLFPRYAEQAQDMAEKVDDISLPGEFNQILNQNASRVRNFIYNGLDNFIKGLYNFLGKVFAIIFSPILAFYIIKDWEKIRDGFMNILSPGARRELRVLSEDIDNVLVEFFKGHLMVATIVGTLVGVSALILGVKLPILIGLLSGVTNLIPYFGPFLGGIPAVVIASSESLRLAIYMTIAILVVQQLEGNIITPKIIGDKLGMHPLIIVFALLAGGKLFGIWGMLFAVPVAAVLKVIIAWAYLKAVEK